MKVGLDYENLQFSTSMDGQSWHPAGPLLDATRLSDDYGEGFSFTGAFFGMAVHDMSGEHCHGDFDWFEYVEDAAD